VEERPTVTACITIDSEYKDKTQNETSYV